MNRSTITHNLFKEIGLNPALIGYDYAKYGVDLVLDDPSQLQNVTKELYPNIAHHFKTTPIRAERALRHLIEKASDTCPAETLYEIFGNAISPNSGRPTVSMFFATMRQEILHREEIGNDLV